MVDFKDINNKKEFLCYKNKQINKLDTLLVEWSEIENKYKNSVLITYWLDDYESFLRSEDKFRKQKRYQKYQRGQVLFVNFGYRVGSELGGNHYAVVLDKYDNYSSNTLTVIPLKSKKNKKLHYTEVDLKNSLKENAALKLEKQRDKLMDSIEKSAVLVNAIQFYMSSLMKSSSPEEHSRINMDFCDSLKIEYKDHNKMTELINLFEEYHKEHLFNQAIDSLNEINVELISIISKLEKDIKTLEKNIKYTDNLKDNSVASISQITTISKMRIINPIRPRDTLSNVKLDEEFLEKINEKIKYLYVY